MCLLTKYDSAPTMKDVAKDAGVSLGTVSKVVNGLPVGKVYQRKVEASIQKLNYQVNSYAKGLKTNKTYTVAFLVPDTFNPFFGWMTYYINRELEKRGYRMLLCATNADTRMEQSYITMAQQNKVDGIICLSYNEGLQVQEGLPLVTIDRHFSGSVPCVSSDNFSGGQMAAQRLDELGCRHVAFLSIGSPLTNETTKRGDGFLSYCASHGLAYELLRLYDGAPFSSFTDFLQQHLAEAVPIDGIFCVNDSLAVKIILYLREQGVRVPEDVQVIGYDGVKDYITEDYHCSTIIQPLDKMAEVSVDMLLSQDWSNTPSLVCLPVTYAPGGTTKE